MKSLVRLAASYWALGVALVLGLAMRLAGCQEAFRQGKVIFSDPDSYYHMRRILVGLANPAQFGSIDLFRGLGNKFPTSWPVYYDGFYVLWIQILTLGQHSRFAAEFLAALLPPLIGTATAVYIYLLGLLLCSSRAWALLATVLFLLMPRELELSSFSAIDHHVAEVLCLCAFLWHLLNCLKSETPRLRGSVFWLVTLFLCWNGSIFYAGIVCVAALVWGLRDAASLERLSRIYGLGAAWLLPLYLFNGDRWTLFIDYLYPSLFHPLALLVMALSLRALADSHKRRFDWRVWSVMVGLGMLLGVQVLKGADLLYGSGGGYSYVPVVAELQPLLSLPMTRLIQMFSWPGLLAFPAAIGLIILGWRQRRSEWLILALVFTLFSLQMLNNLRFAYIVCFLLPLMLVAPLHSLSRKLAPKLRVILGLALPLGVLASVWPLMQTALLAYPLDRSELLAAAHWLRDRTPVTADFLSPHQLPAYSVLASWDLGHFLLYEAERAVVSENFGLNSEIPGRFNFLQDNAAGLALMQEYGARYLLLTSASLYSPEATMKLLKMPTDNWLYTQRFEHEGREYVTALPLPGFANSLFARLFLFDGSDTEVIQVQGLEGLRLVYESPERLPLHIFAQEQNNSHYFLVLQQDYPADMTPFLSRPSRYKIFERVAGARFSLKLAANSAAELTCPVRSNLGRDFIWSRQFRAAKDGSLNGRIPYARTQGPGQTGLTGPCQLTSPQGQFSFEVTPVAVEQEQLLKAKKNGS